MIDSFGLKPSNKQELYLGLCVFSLPGIRGNESRGIKIRYSNRSEMDILAALKDVGICLVDRYVTQADISWLANVAEPYLQSERTEYRLSRVRDCVTGLNELIEAQGEIGRLSKPAEKQSIYIKIWDIVNHSLAIYSQQPIWRSWKSRYPEAQLIHNLPPLLVDPRLTKLDLHWLDSQAYQFVRDGKYIQSYSDVLSLIYCILDLLPEDVRRDRKLTTLRL